MKFLLPQEMAAIRLLKPSEKQETIRYPQVTQSFKSFVAFNTVMKDYCSPAVNGGRKQLPEVHFTMFMSTSFRHMTTTRSLHARLVRVYCFWLLVSITTQNYTARNCSLNRSLTWIFNRRGSTFSIHDFNERLGRLPMGNYHI